MTFESIKNENILLEHWINLYNNYQMSWITFWASLIVETASGDSCFLIEEFQIRIQKDSVFFDSLGTNSFWLSINHYAIVTLALNSNSYLREEFVYYETLGFHLGFELDAWDKVFFRSFFFLGPKMFLLSLLPLLNLRPCLHKQIPSGFHLFILLISWRYVAALIKCIDVSLHGHTHLLPLLRQLWYESHQDVGVECCIVLLWESQRPAFPIWHLLSLADRFAEHFLSHFGETSLGLGCIDLGEIGLGIDEAIDVPEKFHAREFFRKLVHIWVKGETNYHRVRVAENLAQLSIKTLVLLECKEVY